MRCVSPCSEQACTKLVAAFALDDGVLLFDEVDFVFMLKGIVTAGGSTQE